ncbi:IclR family transcriptional regulator, partial [Cupriavidus basilensis]|uniref:IclR family transcriptional regulator n=1 Tax=Cupriavidus basilensis TaxID=68895 RepID=UPI0020A6D949|nr:helix-turn-helix domain-containing protein [Cupriavidus basilensis]
MPALPTPSSPPSPPSPAIPGVQSLDRAFTLLCLLAEHHESGLTLPQLVAQTGIDRTTAHRMLRYLTHAGFAVQDEPGKRFRLGMAAMALGLRTMNRSPLASACATRMKALARKTGDTVFLIVRIGDHGYCMHAEEGSHRVQHFHLLNGSTRLLGQGTASMALLAKLEDQEIVAHYERHRAEYEGSGLSLLKLQRGVERSRKLGYALAGAGGVAGGCLLYTSDAADELTRV